MARRDRPPEWLVGLIIALILAALAYVYADELGFGDEPRLFDPESAVATYRI